MGYSRVSSEICFNYRMNEDESGRHKHLTFAEGGVEGLTIIGNNTNYIYY